MTQIYAPPMPNNVCQQASAVVISVSCRDACRGAQGWVVKAVDVGSGETVAIKLLERGTRLSIDTTCR